MSPERARELLLETAALWHERLRRDPSPNVRRTVLHWLRASHEHRRAYRQVQRTWQALLASAHEAEILALRHETALRLTRSMAFRAPPLGWVAAAAAVLLVIGGVTAMLVTPTGRHWLPAWAGGASSDHTYVTAVGEQLSVTLTDGSHVTLDTQSELRVAFSKQERAVRLLRGQAMFEVAKDKLHPFVVAAGDRRFVAVGTAFNVRVNSDQVKITMVEGTVRVERDPQARSPATVTATTDLDVRGAAAAVTAHTASLSSQVQTITAGDQLVVDDQQIDHLYSVDANLATSWLRGEIVFDDTSLAEAVREFNRYSSLTLKLADPRLAKLRLSGTFAAGRPQLFVEALVNYFPITAERPDSRTVVLKPR